MVKLRSLFSKMRIIIVVFLVLGVVQGMKRVDPVVHTNQGIIRGLRSDDGAYSMFLGIPYGKVDEDKPFGVATPYPKFETTFWAYDDSAICPQEEEFNKTIVGTLDCLHLNIYVPSDADPRSTLPVLVWIHGGGLQVGFAGRYLYGPKFFMRHDIILVTMNYRVGAYGFMCLDTPEIPGNQGLKDQHLGLRWIKDNIASFGGDVNKVTLMGQSAGAALIDFHLWSKQENLFNQIILESGSVFSPWAMAESDLTKPIILAKRLGYETENFSDAISFIAKTDVKSVITAVSEKPPMYFKVCVEKEFENVESFLTEHPNNMRVPNAKNTPILTGYNSHEWMKLYINEPESAFETINIFNTSLNEIFYYDENFFQMEDIVRNFYIGDEKISKAVQWNLVDFHSDHDFIYPVQKSIQKYLNEGAEIYHYLFSYSGERNLIKKRNNLIGGGAAHEDEISYLFDIMYDQSTPTKEDQQMIDRLTTLWTNFVKYGDPTPQATQLLPVKWIPVTKQALNYLSINSKLSMEKRPFKERMAFWKLLVLANKDKLKNYNPIDAST